jgi:hypothetical protein
VPSEGEARVGIKKGQSSVLVEEVVSPAIRLPQLLRGKELEEWSDAIGVALFGNPVCKV